MIKKLTIKLVVFATLASILANSAVYAVEEGEKEQYKQSIEDKSRELEQINSQIQETQENLKTVASEKSTLSSELKKIDYTIKQVNLGIRASEINLSKLNLELEGLNTKVSEVEGGIGDRREAITETLVLLNKKDKEGLLHVFLGEESLVKGAFEIQSLKGIRDQLSANLSELIDLRGVLTNTIEEKGVKKKKVESENQTLKFRKSISEEQKQERTTLLATTKNREQAYQAQLTTLQKQQEAIAEEIQDLEAALRGRIDANQIPPKRPGTLGNPVPDGRLTQGYGRTSFAVRNYPGHWHNGVDFGRFLGAEIVSAEDGKVVALGDQDRYCYRGAYGRFVVIRHFNGLTTLYAHLSGYSVKVGDDIERGELIGYMGKTGWATGPHLHFVVYDSSTFAMKGSRTCGPMPIGGDIDPGDYLLLN